MISYSYLWAREHELGAEEGRKDRPGAIVLARQTIDGQTVVSVVPVTHTPPMDAADAVEIPPALKNYLGLDDQRSWIVVTEINEFLWPGPDLRPIPTLPATSFSYGVLPERFFVHVRDCLLKAIRRKTFLRVPRTE